MRKYNEIIKELKEIKKLGFIETHRSGNTGIGKTLEDLLHIKENNFAGPNSHNTELKSARKESSSMITLFTKSPIPIGINRELLERFGRKKENGGKVLHTTVKSSSKNTLYGKQGFKIDIIDDKVQISHSNYNDMDIPYWDIDTLEKAFKKKYGNYLLYVKADTRKNRKEEFHYNEAWLMHGFDFKNFIKLLKNDKILIDIRIGQNSNGSVHDHGTGFRVFPDNLQNCFSDRHRVI
jgi:hypothetical protein